MCGKFTQRSTWKDVHAFSQPLTLPADGEIVMATPMMFAQVLRLNADGAREVAPMRWGFADRGAKNPARPKHMHARAEGIETKPTFAEAFATRRAILPVHTFNEGEALANGKTKQWTIAPKDGRPLAMAVIWEEWLNGAERLATFILITVPANPLIGRITDRMPAFLAPEDWPTWLGETGANTEELKALLRTWDDAGAWDMAEQSAEARARKTAWQPTLF
jgi:putative SOS response-associated peptidase YedK